MYRTDFWTLWEKARVGWLKRIASKHVYYLWWNRSPAQVGCMIQVLGPAALGRPRGIGWRGKWEGGSGWGIHVNPWLIHVNVWQKPVQYCKVISLQLIKKKKNKEHSSDWSRRMRRRTPECTQEDVFKLTNGCWNVLSQELSSLFFFLNSSSGLPFIFQSCEQKAVKPAWVSPCCWKEEQDSGHDHVCSQQSGQ